MRRECKHYKEEEYEENGHRIGGWIIFRIRVHHFLATRTT